MTLPYEPIRQAGDLYYLAGHTATDPATKKIADNITDQTRCCLENIAKTLSVKGLTFFDVVKTTVFLADMDDFAAMNEVYSEMFQQPFPVRSTVQAACLPKIAVNGPLLVEIDCVAYKESK